MSLVHIYCMPGMWTKSSIFNRIALPPGFVLHLWEWETPEKGETLPQYAQRYAQKIKHPTPVLLGVSFGGVLVQEVAKIVPHSLVVLVSSVKSPKEFSPRMKFLKKSKIYEFFPAFLLEKDVFFRILSFFSKKIKKRMAFYAPYIMHPLSAHYTRWALRALFRWEPNELLRKIVHIQGDSDAIFPAEFVQNPIIVPNATHIMIVNRYRWFNEHLPKIIQTYEKNN